MFLPRALIVLGLLSFAAVASAQSVRQAPSQPAPRLVLQITVDQLRGDLLLRYRDKFGQNGFRLWMDRGVYFANAHYETANTLTCAGHAVLVTGADVAEHGIVGNDWYERDTARLVYCVEDARYPPVGETAKPGTGMSPARLTSTTVGDELVIATGGRARAFAVSGKDRSAVVPGGHRGKAFWFSTASGNMVSSRYYYETLPGWAQEWNARKLFTRYQANGWVLSRPLDTYVNQARAKNVHAHVKAGVGTTFPHLVNMGSEAALLRGLQFTPFLDDLTAQFAQELIAKERLGRNGVTDYLSVSFSSTDYVGHSYGPNSIESEENLVHLDDTLAKLFAFVDKEVGLKNTVIVLSADHGVGDIPEERAEQGFEAERFGGDALQAQLNAALRQRLNVKEDLIAAVSPPGFYLSQAKMRATGVEVRAAETALAEALRALPGIAQAFTRTELLNGQIGHRPILQSVQRAFHAKRSGDVVVVPTQFYYLDETPDYYAATHGTPYSYDTYVPVALWVPGAKAVTSHEPVAPGQIAPTLSALLGIKPPSGCSCGPPLPHVLDHSRR